MDYQTEVMALHRCAASDKPFWQYCTVGAMLLGQANRFGFNPKQLVDSIRQDKIAWEEFVKIAMAFVFIMAQKHVGNYRLFTDGRNEKSAEVCWQIASEHKEIEESTLQMASALRIRLEDLVYDITQTVNVDLANEHRDALPLVTAAQLAFGHPTIQQTFAQACVLALFHKYNEQEKIKDKEYLFPFI